MAQEEIKRGKGRPRKKEPTKAISFRIETDLLEWLQDNKDERSINQRINDIIRKEIGL